MSDPTNFLSKLCVIGDAAVGKSSLVLKYTSNSFQEEYISTIGAQFCTYEHLTGENQNISYKLLLWDLAGQQEYKFMRPTFYNGAEAAVLVFDVVRPETLDNIIDWYNEMKQNCGNIPSVIFGNKSDLLENEDTYDESKVKDIMKKNGIQQFYLTSAKTGKHVSTAFNSIIDILLKGKLEKMGR